MKQNDITYGLKEEENIKSVLETFFNVKLKKSKDKYASYDFKSKGVRYELKSRTFKSDLYKTSFLNKTKVDYYKKIREKKKFIVIFNFTDKIKYIEFNDDLLNLPIKKIPVKRGEIVQNIEIPNSLLLDLII